jgi:excisionase family DNA binding protein
MTSDRMTVRETAKLLGVSSMTVSLWLRQGDCPLGTAIKRGPGKWTYLVWKKEVMKFAEEKGINRGDACQI